MVGTTRVKVEGLKEIKAALHKLLPPSTAKGVMRKVLRQRAKPIVKTAKDLAPVGPTIPGELKRSIRVSSKQKSGRQQFRSREDRHTVYVYIGPTKDGYPQAIMQEFGTINHPPQPYMRPAWDKHKGSLLPDIGKDMWTEIRAAVARRAGRR